MTQHLTRSAVAKATAACTYAFIAATFLLGAYFYATYQHSRQIETMVDGSGASVRCPNLLVQKRGKYYLYNTKIDEVPGVNPVIFDTLDDYTDFLDWQHKIGIRCPVLYLQHTNTAHGHGAYTARPSVHNLHGGAPSGPPSHTHSGGSGGTQKKGGGAKGAMSNVPHGCPDPSDAKGGFGSSPHAAFQSSSSGTGTGAGTACE